MDDHTTPTGLRGVLSWLRFFGALAAAIARYQLSRRLHTARRR